MAKTMFSVDGIAFSHLKVLSCTQSYKILDGDNSGRVLTGEMTRDIIGTYFNYTLKLKPEYTVEGMKEYNKLWDMCSNPVESHTLVIPFDVGEDVTHTTLTYQAYITGGSREMLRYDYEGTDYWKEGEFQFVAMDPTRRPQ